MRRFQLFEFHDQPWFPATFHRAAVEFLRLMSAKLGIHHTIAPLIAEVLAQTGARQIVDLCSGASGPLVPICKELESSGLRISVSMTDKYPPACGEFAGSPQLDYLPESVDATRVPRTLKGLRTIFNAFHHFPPAEARQILKSAFESHQPIAIFEVPERSILNLLATPLIFFSALWIIIQLKPRRFWALFFSYVIPLIPLSIAWDGFVSNLRTYTVAELISLTRGLGSGYDWQAGQVALDAIPAHVTFLLGIPSNPVATDYPLPVASQNLIRAKSNLTGRPRLWLWRCPRFTWRTPHFDGGRKSIAAHLDTGRHGRKPMRAMDPASLA